MVEKKTTSQKSAKASGPSANVAGDQPERKRAVMRRGLVKTREGIVVSNKMQKTVVVAVERQVKHSTYGKFVRRTSKYYAHDENGSCGMGDRVRIVETRPLSRMKRWRVCEVLRKGEVVA